MVFYGVHVQNSDEYGDARILAAMARDAEDAGWDGFLSGIIFCTPSTERFRLLIPGSRWQRSHSTPSEFASARWSHHWPDGARGNLPERLHRWTS